MTQPTNPDKAAKMKKLASDLEKGRKQLQDLLKKLDTADASADKIEKANQ
jgi:hypothetical protein